MVAVFEERKDASLPGSYGAIALRSRRSKLRQMLDQGLLYFYKGTVFWTAHRQTSKMFDPRTMHLCALNTFETMSSSISSIAYLCLTFKGHTTPPQGATALLWTCLGTSGHTVNRLRIHTIKTFWVNLCSAISRIQVQEGTMPQGRVFRCTLFIVKTN